MGLLSGGNEAISLLFKRRRFYCPSLQLDLFFLGNLTDGVLRPPLLTPSMLGGWEMLGGPVLVWGTAGSCGILRDPSGWVLRDTAGYWGTRIV